MKSEFNRITTLSEDIRQIVKQTQGENFEMVRLCKDHYNPILFYDNKSILNITQDDLVGIFDMNSNHFFLKTDQAFRLGQYCKLSLPGIIALMMKAEWEIFFSNTMDYLSKKLSNLESILKNDELIQRYKLEFKPDKGLIYNLFSKTQTGQISNFHNDHIEFIISDL